MTKDEAMGLRAKGSRVVMERAMGVVDRRHLPNIDDTLVGITHVADRWERDADGTLVLVLEPRGCAVNGTSVTEAA